MISFDALRLAGIGLGRVMLSFGDIVASFGLTLSLLSFRFILMVSDL